MECADSASSREVETVLARLQTVLNACDRRTSAELAVGSGADLRVLRLLLHEGPVRVSALAHIRASAVATVSSRLDRLERRGLLERRRTLSDRRAVEAVLTDAGRRVATTSRDLRVAVLDTIDRSDLGIDGLESLVDALAPVATPTIGSDP